MATDIEQLDDGEEAQVAWLLEAGHDTPEIPREFVSALSQQLDAEFALIHSNGVHAAAATPSMNGSAKSAVDAKELFEVAPERGESSGAKKTVRSRRRWLLSIVAAASVVVGAAIVSNPPAWAAAVRAIVQRLEAFATGGAGEEADVAGVAEEHLGVAVVKEERRVARVEVAKPQAIVRPAPQVKAAAPVAPAPAVEAKEKAAQKQDTPHPAIKESDWKPFDKPLADDELTRRVDTELARQWQKNGIRPVEAATDAEFMRRVYLDLTGRIPTVSEVHEFFDDTSPNRRELLVERLLVHRDHATHLAALWHAVLLPNEVDLSRLGGGDKFDEWLADRFAANVPYDQIVRELLLAEGRDDLPGACCAR